MTVLRISADLKPRSTKSEKRCPKDGSQVFRKYCTCSRPSFPTSIFACAGGCDTVGGSAGFCAGVEGRYGGAPAWLAEGEDGHLPLTLGPKGTIGHDFRGPVPLPEGVDGSGGF